MCTYNQCFRAKKKKKNILKINFHSREILLYIARVCLRNVTVIFFPLTRALCPSFICTDEMALSVDFGQIAHLLS